jgi:hypothetical protein
LAVPLRLRRCHTGLSVALHHLRDMSSEFGESSKAADEDDLTALEKFGNQFYNGVCGVLCVLSDRCFVFLSSLVDFVLSPFSLFCAFALRWSQVYYEQGNGGQ